MNLTAFVAEQLTSDERASDIYSRLLRERIIYLGGSIDGDSASLVCAQLLLLEGANPDKPISMYINSLGGSITDSLAIYDTMQHVKCPVFTLCIGMTASTGSFLLMAGHRGERAALPNAKVILRQPHRTIKGQALDIERHADEISKMKRRLAELYAFHCGGSVEDFERILGRDVFLNAEEAQTWGLIDKIFGLGERTERSPKGTSKN